jgi:hypothetical protein
LSTVTEEYSATAADGKKYKTKFYSLEAVIAVGYRVNSSRGTQFRIWATEKLKHYILSKGTSLSNQITSVFWLIIVRQRRNMTKLNLNYKDDHLFIRIDGALWLLDTGAPSTFPGGP